jgi:diadenylate cyclase
MQDERSAHLDAVFGPVAESTRCARNWRRTVEEVVELGVELAREGREGRKIGTLFVVGDVVAVLARSRQLLLDPLHGHDASLLHVSLPDFRETVKELAQLDGAFVVDSAGTFVSAARYIEVDTASSEFFLPGLGTRHAAAASISAATRAVAVVVSQSSVVRVFAGGEVRAEIIPELFLLSRQRFYARQADVQLVPEAGVTVAVAGSSPAA